MKGSCLECMGNFAGYADDSDVFESSELSTEFLSSISFEISEIDKKGMTVTINLKVPQIVDTLNEVAEKTISSNPNMDYDKLKTLIENEIIAYLSSDSVDLKEATITLPLEEVDKEYKISATEEWNRLIYGELIQAYIDAFSQIGGEIE